MLVLFLPRFTIGTIYGGILKSSEINIMVRIVTATIKSAAVEKTSGILAGARDTCQ